LTYNYITVYWETMTQTYKTKNEMTVCYGWQNREMTIPKGSKVKPASHLPEGSGFWLVKTPKALRSSVEAVGWVETYGILIRPEEVEAA